MTGEKSDSDEAAKGREGPRSGGQHERSTIVFPYLDLDTAVEVARATYNRGGHGGCDIDELAAEMEQTVSGAFRLKTSAAKIFGLIDKDGRSAFRLTNLGQRIVSEQTERSARVEAFLEVPLYAAIYDQYRGHNLPPPKALEREMHNLGVSSKQTDKARQAFERSARQAGFFESGDNRLVRPRTDDSPASPPQQQQSSQEPTTQSPRFGGGGDGSVQLPNKPLKYQLIDLLDPNTMEEDEQAAVWTLINYLARIESGIRKPKAADDESPSAA